MTSIYTVLLALAVLLLLPEEQQQLQRESTGTGTRREQGGGGLLFVESISVPHECSACLAVMKILRKNLEEEKPFGDASIDLRNRLDPNGNRLGKKIAYKESELRVETLTGKMCNGLRYYSYIEPRKTKSEKPAASKAVTGGEGWKKLTMKKFTGKDEAYHKQMNRKINSYCGYVLDEHVRGS